MENQKEKPFSQGYVLRTTAKHMRRCVDISIRKTYERLPEFVEGPKSVELFKTLGVLHGMLKALDEFQAKHQEDFK
jgi:hypothetical protein